MEKTRRYPYSAKWKTIIPGFLLFGLACVLFSYKGMYADRGLIISHIIELSVRGARIFYWVLFGLSFLFVAVSLAGAYYKLTEDPTLELDDEKIVIPPTVFVRISRQIYISEITSVTEEIVKKTKILSIRYGEKRSTITSALLDTQSEYDEIRNFLFHKVKRTAS